MKQNIYSVEYINAYIKAMFSQDFLLRSVYVRGEVSNVTYHPSGHIYFTMKDKSGTLSCVMFSGKRREGLKFTLKEGQQIVCGGSITIYEARGQYQMYATDIVLDGEGLLYEKYEKLKKELEEKGMFDACYKRSIPKYAKRIGIVTAKTGAAIQDIINISKRRNPYVKLFLYPCLVQGEGAAISIVNAIRALDKFGVDVIIVGRGGGSIEDLWAFNEEIVARAIYDSKVPVISAVGHEIDFTISDYVADKRAATPTAAAELAVPNVNELLLNIDKCYERCTNSVVSLINRYKEILNKIKKSSILINPVNLYNAKKQMLLIDTKNLNNSINNILTINNMHLFRLKNSYIITNPNMIYEKKLIELKNNINALELLNPLSSLKRGYGIVKKENKCI